MDTSNYLNAGLVGILDNAVKRIVPIVAPTVEAEYLKYTNKVIDNQLIKQINSITGLGMGQVIMDGQTPSIDYPLQGFTKTAVQKIFTHRVRMGHQAANFLLGGLAGEPTAEARLAKVDASVKPKLIDLKNAITHTKNYLMQSILANGWSSTFSFVPLTNGITEYATVSVDTATADGVALWSTAHVREDGGTSWGNVVISSGVNNPPFTYSALAAARQQHAQKKDGRGLPITGSNIDTIMFLNESSSHQLARSISKTIERGYFPTTTLGTSGVFNDAPTVGGFNIIGLTNYGGSGVTGLMWFGFDSKMINQDSGFQYVVTKELDMLPVYQDLGGNLDIIITALEYSNFMVADLRYWQVSRGDSQA